MASVVFPEKRTRSQLALPDDLLLQLSQGSPLKDARTALRHNTSRTEAATGSNEEIVEDLLLSPHRPIQTTRMAKRSVSPPPGNEYAFKPESPSDGRELKRMKLNDSAALVLNGQTMHVLPSRPAHTRSFSQPEYIKDLTRAHSGTARGSSTDAPLQSVPGETELTVKGRARSVPLFLSTSSSGIMHIDLRNPPASPRRPRSRSPSKERELRIITGPAVISKLDTIQDEAVNEQGPSSLPPSITCKDPVSDAPSIANKSATGTIIEVSLPPPTPLNKRPPSLVLSVVVQPPTTPIRELSPLSPLTPISDTPLPSSSASEGKRFVGSGLATSHLEEAPVLPVSPSKPSLGLATITKSRLPRPSSSTNLALSATQPPKAISPLKRLVASSSTRPATTAPQVNNAFAVLMANARESKNQVKGKGKGKAALPKIASSSGVGFKSASGSAKPRQKGKTLDTGKAKEISPSKPSLKSKMKPKMAPKPKPKPSSAVIASPPPEAKNEQEASPPPSSSLQQLSSSPRSAPSAPPTTPLAHDVSMESISPVVEPDVPMEVDVTLSTEPSHSDQGAGALATAPEPPMGFVEPTPPIMPKAPVETTDSDVLGETHMSVIKVVNVPSAGDLRPVANASNATSIAPAEDFQTIASSAEPISLNPPIRPAPTKPSRTKAHISKRKPSSIPAPTRITRSVSLKRNQKVSEIPEALPGKATEKPVLAKQKSLTPLIPEVVASGSSSKLDDEIPSDPAPSTSNPSSFSTEPVNPGSPKKVGSPVKPSPKTSRSSYAQPTKSTLTKQVSPKKATLSKSRHSSSPNKLARSVSMLSRPRVSLSRSFTSYSTLEGSSLSTLSSALEKLQQRPPERPNTSMGFNRDDPDSSFELKDTSKDDNSIQPSSSDESKAASSSKGGSRLMQRTLFGGPRSSITGKFTVGSLGSGTRGTSGFKIPGQPLKTGSRIFGAGGGLFSGAARARTMQKASRKTSLPSVMASPVKGGDVIDTTDDDIPQGGAQDPDALPLDISAEGMAPDNDKGKGKERLAKPWDFDVSLAPQALFQSLNVSSAKGVGSMGPPATPKGRQSLRSVSSTYPSTSSGAEASGRISLTRTSFRPAEKTSNTGASGGNLTSMISATNQPESLQFLKDCIIFVDVKNDDGDDVGSLFVEMLEGVGARILTRVGQTCTHIVFKNGLMSTLNRYRLLRDPKPSVVGIAWVVECVEQRKHIDEAKFLIDLDGINVSGTNKRRRSMLPKLISHDFEERGSSDVEGDVSLDGSTSSITLDDKLTPLEKARRRTAGR